MPKKQIIILLVLVAIIILGGVAYGFYYKQKYIGKGVACTMEAKLCPDGSSVGRTGPNCEFAECPKTEKNSFCRNLCGDGSCQEIVCFGAGCICAETAESCPQDCAQNTNDILMNCQRDSDCACGTKVGTDECFYGNKKYVNTAKQCPDFCGGFDGSILMKCVNKLCVQQYK